MNRMFDPISALSAGLNPAPSPTGPAKPRQIRTQKQAEAARINGRKSRGPRRATDRPAPLPLTDHGVVAYKLRPKSEGTGGDEDYELIRKSLWGQFQPCTASQELLIELLADDYRQLLECKMLQGAVMACPGPALSQFNHPAGLHEELARVSGVIAQLRRGETPSVKLEDVDSLRDLVAQVATDLLESEQARPLKPLLEAMTSDPTTVREVLTGGRALDPGQTAQWTEFMSEVQEFLERLDSQNDDALSRAKMAWCRRRLPMDELQYVLLLQRLETNVSTQIERRTRQLQAACRNNRVAAAP